MNFDAGNELFNAIFQPNRIGNFQKLGVSYEQQRKYTGAILGKKCDYSHMQSDLISKFSKTCYLTSKSPNENGLDIKTVSLSKDEILKQNKLLKKEIKASREKVWNDASTEDFGMVRSIFRQNFQTAKMLTENCSRKKFHAIRSNGSVPPNPTPTPEENNRVRVKVVRKDAVPKFERQINGKNNKTPIQNSILSQYSKKKAFNNDPSFRQIDPVNKECKQIRLINQIEAKKLEQKQKTLMDDHGENSTSQSRSPKLKPMHKKDQSISKFESYNHCNNSQAIISNNVYKSFINDTSILEINQLHFQSNENINSSIILDEKKTEKDIKNSTPYLKITTKSSTPRIQLKKDSKASTPRIKSKRRISELRKKSIENLNTWPENSNKINTSKTPENELNEHLIKTESNDITNTQEIKTEEEMWENMNEQFVKTDNAEVIDYQELKMFKSNGNKMGETINSHRSNKSVNNNLAMKKYWMPIKYTKRRTGKKLIGNLVKNSLNSNNKEKSEISEKIMESTPKTNVINPRDVYLNDLKIEEFNLPIYMNINVNLKKELKTILKKKEKKKNKIKETITNIKNDAEDEQTHNENTELTNMEETQHFEASDCANEKSAILKNNNQEESSTTEKSLSLEKLNGGLSKSQILKNDLKKLKNFNELDTIGYNPIPIRMKFQNSAYDKFSHMQAKKVMVDSQVPKHFVIPSSRFCATATYDKRKNSRIENLIEQRPSTHNKNHSNYATPNKGFKSFENLDVQENLDHQENLSSAKSIKKSSM